MLPVLFKNIRGYLDYFFSSVDLAQTESVLQKLVSCRGTIFLVGVGKSGHIAQKVAATLISTGTKAAFLSPDHALHGDIGVVCPEDTLLLFSKSGESEEVLELLQHAKKRRAATIAIVCQLHSRLAQAADLSIHLPLQRELCPHNLAPTTSTAMQLIWGDCLAIALMQAKQFSVADFALNHPGGLLGKKITLRVSDLMLKEEAIPTCAKQHRLIEVLHELTAKRCGCLLVSEAGILQGIFTDGDLRRAIETMGSDALQVPIEKLMCRSPRTTSSTVLAWDALRQMEEDPARLITVLPVVDDGQIRGLLRMHDILQAGLR